jgi:hypothetical protein
MSDDADVFGDVPSGRKLPSGPAPGNVGTVNAFGKPATLERVGQARRFFTEASIDDFEVAGEHDGIGGLQIWVDRDYRRGAITPDEWHAFRDEIRDERLAEAERASRLRAQVDTIADELNQVEARRVAAQRVAELRASLAGEVAAREGDVDALRAIVGRTFEAVVLHHIGDGLHLLPVVHEHMLRSLHPWDLVEPSRQAAPVQRGHGGT